MQDFFQLLQPGLQLLRPPKKDYRGPLLANMVPYTAQSFTDEWGMQPSQVRHHPKSISRALYQLVCLLVCLCSVWHWALYLAHFFVSDCNSVQHQVLLQIDACFDCLLVCLYVCLSVCDYAAFTPVHAAGLQFLPLQFDGPTVCFVGLCVCTMTTGLCQLQG